MATIKKAQLGGLIKKGVKAAVETAPKKVTIPAGLKKSLKKSQSGPTKLKVTGASEAEQIAHGKQPFLQKKPYKNPNYEKESFLEREVRKSKPKPKTDEYGFDIRPDRNGGTHKKKMKNGGSLSGLKASNKRVGSVDPKGAFTKVQKKTLAGAKGKASLTKDKQLGATKMAKQGMSVKKK
jgi:hypothetical protein